MAVCFEVADKKSNIYIDRDIRYNVGKFIDLNRKVLVLTDDGVPKQYAHTIAAQCSDPYIKVVPQGERSKSLETVQEVIIHMEDNGFDESDLLFAVGGGVIGDLGGFVASMYYCGIQVASLPTTSLSQIDSSIGGKTAVNVNHVKNIVGSFYQPSKVFIDLNTLSTLTKREYYSGLVESLKAAMLRDPGLFELFCSRVADFNGKEPPIDVEEMIIRALYVKKDIVDKDEKEQGLRKLLNFGHTIGHAIESIYMPKYYHGECVGVGMLMIMENEELRNKVKKILEKMGMPTHIDFDVDEAMNLIKKDKKYNGSKVSIVQVDEVGKGYLKDVDLEWIRERMEDYKI